MFESSLYGCCRPYPGLAAMSGVRPPTLSGPPQGRQRMPVSRPPGRAADQAELLILGKVITMDPARPEAGGLAVRDGRVLALGSQPKLDGLRGPGTEAVELGDGVARPGLVEPHMHLWSTVLFDSWPDCSPPANPTFDAVVERLRAVAAATRPGEWVTGKLFDPSLYPGEPELTAAWRMPPCISCTPAHERWNWPESTRRHRTRPAAGTCDPAASSPASCRRSPPSCRCWRRCRS